VRYYRVQPAGLEIQGHRSEASVDDDEPEGIDVFLCARGLFRMRLDEREVYGDEVLVIEGGEWWDNEDVEGGRIDPEEATIVRRLTWEEADALVDGLKGEEAIAAALEP